jgi:hypothetical protein
MMAASNPGEAGIVTTSHQEERMTSGLESMTIEADSSDSPTGGPTNTVDKTNSRNTPAIDSGDMQLDLGDDTDSGEATPTGAICE